MLTQGSGVLLNLTPRKGTLVLILARRLGENSLIWENVSPTTQWKSYFKLKCSTYFNSRRGLSITALGRKSLVMTSTVGVPFLAAKQPFVEPEFLRFL